MIRIAYDSGIQISHVYSATAIKWRSTVIGLSAKSDSDRAVAPSDTLLATGYNCKKNGECSFFYHFYSISDIFYCYVFVFATNVHICVDKVLFAVVVQICNQNARFIKRERCLKHISSVNAKTDIR